MKARTAMASPAETSSWATSAAHDRRNAAPTIASPKTTASSVGWAWVPESRMTSPGDVAMTAKRNG